ncbi:MAG TPA: SDR family oxidoreductase [Bacteroidales bacterium]|nr:SDR family oxidoreductase [Bacteroidales bacterium]
MDKRHVIITGGAQGIGKQSSLSFLKNGYTVTIADIDDEAGKETVNELKSYGDVEFLPCDVSLEKDVAVTIQKAFDYARRIDVLVNNAAIAITKPVTELTLDEWNRVMGINATGAFLCAKHAAPYLKASKGSIINICSTRAFMSEANTEAYSTSKGAVYSLTHALAISLGPEVRVNCISPGWIDVSELKKSSKRNKLTLSLEDHAQHPAGRVGTANDIARLLLFLADEKNTFVTGQNFIVDGGMTRKMIYV